MEKVQFGIALFLSLFLAFLTDVTAQEILLSQQEIQQIGERVFKNECASKDENLIAWNEGEDFMSLGIGHFIWHPKNGKDSFEESFIKFLEYAKSSGEQIPAWLDITPFPACPWSSRDSFLSAQGDSRLMELKGFLIKTKPLQAVFITRRLEESLPFMLKSAPEGIREKIALQFHRVASTSSGVYALADYVNFKGLGIAPGEKYQGKGWGLLQVLEGMKDQNEAPDAVGEFARLANAVLEDRVKNSSLVRNEQKWLPGWQKRVNSYIEQEEIACLQE
ncbi:MAG: hypothetical protein FJZ15_05685 [Candidatus Omnitrophica bacterium]|nr:hypothetical protein [Candidatus Omnitrophota bacterium]